MIAVQVDHRHAEGLERLDGGIGYGSQEMSQMMHLCCLPGESRLNINRKYRRMGCCHFRQQNGAVQSPAHQHGALGLPHFHTIDYRPKHGMTISYGPE